MNKPRLLFLCTGNSARSQMVEGFLRHLADDKFDVYSAGVNPTQTRTAHHLRLRNNLSGRLSGFGSAGFIQTQ